LSAISYREAIQAAIAEEMRNDHSVFLLGMNQRKRGGVFQVTKGLIDEFGENRIFDMPISESVMLGSAIGASILGSRPVVDLMFCDFLAVAADQIVNHAAKIRYMYGGKASVPLTVRMAYGAGTSWGCSHSQSLESWTMHVPGLKVVMPSTPIDAKGLLKTAIRDNDPVMFFEHRLLYAKPGPAPAEGETIPLGKADVKKQGDDITVVATGMMVHKALEASESLSKEGIEVEIVDPRTLVPLDKEAIIASVEKTGRLLITHEANLTVGIGAEIAAIAANAALGYLEAPIERVCAPDTPVPYSPPLEQHYLPQAADIVKTAKKMMST
jgi:pyruvate dehydrogenase E1 component beta subunit